MGYPLQPDELSRSMIEAVLRFVDTRTPVEGLHHQTARGLIHRGLLRVAYEQEPWRRGEYPTDAGMVLAGIVHAQWHLLDRLVARLAATPEGEAAVDNANPYALANHLVPMDELPPKVAVGVNDLLAEMLQARHPELHRAPHQPSRRAAREAVEKVFGT